MKRVKFLLLMAGRILRDMHFNAQRITEATKHSNPDYRSFVLFHRCGFNIKKADLQLINLMQSAFFFFKSHLVNLEHEKKLLGIIFGVF